MDQLFFEKNSHSINNSMILFLIILILMLSNTIFAQTNSHSVKPVEYNKDQLVKMAVQGFIAPPGFSESAYEIDPNGKIHVVPGTGSITYNFKTGDTAINIAGDHVEPAVTLYNPGSSGSRSSWESKGLNTLSCIGNRVKVLNGEAKGAEGWVIGKHGGAARLYCWPLH